MEIRPTGKRGAIELSMTTVVIVVIGITLLTLGLRWIYNIFGGLESTQTQLHKLSEEEILRLFEGSDNSINMPQAIVSIEQGKKAKIAVYIRNILEETHSFKYGVAPETIPIGAQALVTKKLVWYKSQMNLESGKGFQDFIDFDSKGLSLGTYRFRVELSCLDCATPEKDSLPLSIDVTAGR